MVKEHNAYIPALSFPWLTPIYDSLMKWMMREETFKRRLIKQAQFNENQRALDVGCGTGTLTIMIKRQYPGLEITGLDGDPQVLEIAKAKADQANAAIQWDLGMAYDLPYEDASFDRVVSSLMIHHLVSEDKRRTFQEINRVLKPGGEFHLVDFGVPHQWGMKIVASIMVHFEEVADNLKGYLPGMLSETGFSEIEEKAQLATLLGSLTFISARK